MKTIFLYTAFVTTLLLSSAAVMAQTTVAGKSAGGGSATVTVGPSTSTTTPNPATPGARISQPQTLPNGTVSGNGSQTIFTNNNMASATNGFSGTNGFAGASNGSTVTATVNPLTNGFVNTTTNINGNIVFSDQAVTPSDRVLLTTISQGVKATLGIQPNGNIPVHFMINNGTVTIVGTVQSTEQSRSVLAQVQQTPGVATVINDLHVASPLGIAQSRTVTPNSVFAGAADHAFSPADQTLLTTVQQVASMQLGITSSAQMPVHFSIQNGVVGVTGQVASLQEKQALLAAIGRTRGIVRVVDNVGILNGAVGLGLAPGTPSTPTSRPNGSNTIFLNTTNPSGF